MYILHYIYTHVQHNSPCSCSFLATCSSSLCNAAKYCFSSATTPVAAEVATDMAFESAAEVASGPALATAPVVAAVAVVATVGCSVSSPSRCPFLVCH